MEDEAHDVSPIYDSFDLDLIVKVLSHTAFSKLCMSDISFRAKGIVRPFLCVFYPGVLYFSRSQADGPSSGALRFVLCCDILFLCVIRHSHGFLNGIDTNIYVGFLRWYSRLYRNQGSLLFGNPPLDWGEQIIVVTGGTSLFEVKWECQALTRGTGASGVGELLANTLAVRNVNVVVLDIKPIITENCAFI
jgi:hypothetical protein